MSEGISAPFIRYPIGTSLMMAGILFVGLVAYPLLPVAPLPQVDFPTIQVAASLPGASPETMASSVAQPLERQLAVADDARQQHADHEQRRGDGPPDEGLGDAHGARPGAPSAGPGRPRPSPARPAPSFRSSTGAPG